MQRPVVAVDNVVASSVVAAALLAVVVGKSFLLEAAEIVDHIEAAVDSLELQTVVVVENQAVEDKLVVDRLLADTLVVGDTLVAGEESLDEADIPVAVADSQLVAEGILAEEESLAETDNLDLAVSENNKS